MKYSKLTNNYPKLVDFDANYTGPSSSSYKTGYHIFTRLTSLPPSIIANNICKFDNGVWFDYMSYSNAPEVLDINYRVKNDIGCFISTGGKFYANGAEINGTINATSGTIGGFNIESNHIGSTATANNEFGGNLSIYSNFFRVGGSSGYVLFGDNVIPATSGGAFNATGRIVNQTINQGAQWGFDACNTGLYIRVSGGTKNFGIDSDAAIKAPAFINTKVGYLLFDGDTYSIDLSQYSVFMCNATSAKNVNMPSEASIAKQFSLSSLPSDFGCIFTFHVIGGSSDIILNNVTDWNENVIDLKLVKGDSVQLLVTKVPTFHYQVINHTN